MDFPNNRLTYTGVKGPLFDDEVKNALNALYESVNLILGLAPTDFAILSGFDFTPGAPGAYNGGIVYMSGIIYYFSGDDLVEGLYLNPNIFTSEPKPHGDGVTRSTYQFFNTVASNTPIAGSSPIFSGNMNNYRWNMVYAKSQAIAAAVATAQADATARANAAQANAEAYADSINANMITIVLDIGDWDMTSNSPKSVTHGIVDITKVRNIRVMIQDDVGAVLYNLETFAYGTGLNIGGSINFINNTSINLTRMTGGNFDNSGFNATSYNRGWITIQQQP